MNSSLLIKDWDTAEKKPVRYFFEIWRKFLRMHWINLGSTDSIRNEIIL